MRKMPLITGEHYHVYNRGVDKRMVVLNNNDSDRFILSLTEFNSVEPIGSIYENRFKGNACDQLGRPTSKLVDIVTYCLNPNHYHFILKQLKDGGISEFMKRLGGGYTKYFNEKEQRTGALFQGKFKSSHISTNDHLRHLSTYVNLNYQVHKIFGENLKLVRSGWDEYINKSFGSQDICSGKDAVLKFFNSRGEYKKFAEKNILEIIEERQKIKDFEKLMLEGGDLDVGRPSK